MEENMTNHERIKNMTLDEMAAFFAKMSAKGFIETADKVICRKCKADHGGHCPIEGDEGCLYEMSDKDTLKLWLEMGETDEM
jgi:hypothetical protein